MPNASHMQLAGLSKLQALTVHDWVFYEYCTVTQAYQSLFASVIKTLVWHWSEDPTRMIESRKCSLFLMLFGMPLSMAPNLDMLSSYWHLLKHGVMLPMSLSLHLADFKSHLSSHCIFVEYNVELSILPVDFSRTWLNFSTNDLKFKRKPPYPQNKWKFPFPRLNWLVTLGSVCFRK